MQEPENCPKCGVSFLGAEIPEKAREYYGNQTHFSRVIALVDYQKDCATHWKCPDCGHTWSRDGR